MTPTDITLLDERFGHSLRALRNGSASGPTMITEIVDLSILLEALVLFDRPVIRQHDAMPIDYLNQDPVLAPFIEAGILEVQPYANSEITELLAEADPVADGSELRFHLFIGVGNAIAAAETNSRYVASSVVLPAECERLILSLINDTATEATAGISEVTAQELSLYASAVTIVRAIGTIAGSTDPLLRSYSEWSSDAEDRLRTLASWGKPIPLVMPPIAAIVFEASQRIEDVGRVALSLRDDLEGHRTKLRQYSAKIREDDVPLGEAVDAARNLQSALAAVKSPNGGSITNLVNFPELFGAGAAFASGPQSGLVATAKTLLGKPLQHVIDRLRRRDAMFIAAIDERFSQIRTYSSNVHRLVGRTFAESEYETAANWLAGMRTWTATSRPTSVRRTG